MPSLMTVLLTFFSVVDFNRVQLTGGEEKEYINASYVKVTIFYSVKI